MVRFEVYLLRYMLDQAFKLFNFVSFFIFQRRDQLIILLYRD